MLCKEVIDVCSEILTKQTKKMCGQNVKFLSVISGGT